MLRSAAVAPGASPDFPPGLLLRDEEPLGPLSWETRVHLLLVGRLVKRSVGSKIWPVASRSGNSAPNCSPDNTTCGATLTAEVALRLPP